MLDGWVMVSLRNFIVFEKEIVNDIYVRRFEDMSGYYRIAQFKVCSLIRALVYFGD